MISRLALAKWLLAVKNKGQRVSRVNLHQTGNMDTHRHNIEAKENGVDSNHDRLPHTRLARFLNPVPGKTLRTVCVILLILWCFWWATGLQRLELKGISHLWFPSNWGKGIGCDFINHVDHAARVWWNGGDPYADKIVFFPYPPSSMRFFAWVNLMSPRAALMVWCFAMAIIIAAAAYAASRWRQRLALVEIPPVAALVLILFSTPTLFAMERGQSDPLSLLFILTALPLLQHPARWSQYLAGAVLCLTPWVKAYPGLIFVGLIGLRKWRALAGFSIAGLAIAAYFLLTGEMQKFLVNNSEHILRSEYLVLLSSGVLHPWEHPLSSGLASLWLGSTFHWLGLLPGKIIAVALLISALVWVSYHVYTCPRRETVVYPYLLWIVALATFVPPVSNDYNLVFLPLAVLAAWDRRDPLLVQVALALLLIWWQPIGMSISGNAFLVIKLLGLGAVAVCLVERTCEQAEFSAAESIYEIKK